MTPPLQNYFFAGATAALALLFVAWYGGYTFGLARSLPTQNTQASTQTDSRSLIGKITDITGTTLILSTPGSEPATREIRIDSNTTFGRLTPKDQDTYQKEVEAFRQKVQIETKNENSFPEKDFPTSSLFEQSSFADLRVGSVIQVIAATDIVSQRRLVATGIVIWPGSLTDTTPRASP